MMIILNKHASLSARGTLGQVARLHLGRVRRRARYRIQQRTDEGQPIVLVLQMMQHVILPHQPGKPRARQEPCVHKEVRPLVAKPHRPVRERRRRCDVGVERRRSEEKGRRHHGTQHDARPVDGHMKVLLVVVPVVDLFTPPLHAAVQEVPVHKVLLHRPHAAGGRARRSIPPVRRTLGGPEARQQHHAAADELRSWVRKKRQRSPWQR
mmetsp:Transcript_53456/g.170055  ORF Transcript_53456/g.170055 Transcript_53456/m.170055 type:complete len:209 (+) Transcript_53456:754-1380(+)